MPTGNILVVEDDESIRLLLIESLKEHELDVEGACDGVDALHQVSSRQYAVVLLDLMMPYMTGIDFLDSLSALTSDPSVQTLEKPPAIIIITGAPPEQISTDEIEQRYGGLVRAVLRKPLDVLQLTEMVTGLLA